MRQSVCAGDCLLFFIQPPIEEIISSLTINLLMQAQTTIPIIQSFTYYFSDHNFGGRSFFLNEPPINPPARDLGEVGMGGERRGSRENFAGRFHYV
jgi:hypothetical protein